MDLAEKITNLVKEMAGSVETETRYREPLVGFASAHDHLFTQMKSVIGPYHLHPREMMPEAETVIAFFLPFAENIIRDNRLAKDVPESWAKAYVETNQLIAAIDDRLQAELEAEGIAVVYQRATHNFNEVDLTAAWSHKSAAFVAGLGTFGVNRLLITSAGCGGRYGSLVISAKIPPTPRPATENCRYYRGDGCLFCVKNCPTGALEVDKLDKQKCYRQLLDVAALFPGLCDVCGKCNIGPCALGAD